MLMPLQGTEGMGKGTDFCKCLTAKGPQAQDPSISYSNYSLYVPAGRYRSYNVYCYHLE